MKTLILVAGLTLAACGGSQRTGRKVVATPKLEAVKRGALREFDGGLRALRLGGPEADEQALGRFKAAVQIDPSLWEANHDLGVVLGRLGDDVSAVTAFDAALRVNPAHTPSVLARAEALRRLRRTGDAKKGYEEALARDPDDAVTRVRLASLLREAGDTGGALDALRAALRIRPSDARIYVELGLLYLAADRDELAELVLGKATQLDPKDPLALNALAMVSLKRGNDQQAFERFDAASALDPEYSDARFNKAGVLLDAGDYTRAKTELEAVVSQRERALQAAGDSPSASGPTNRGDVGDLLDAKVALGVAYRGLGEYDRAAAEWKRVLETSPRQPDALYNLAVLSMDFKRDEAQAKELLARYLQVAPESHARRKDAEVRMRDLGGAK